MAHDVKKQRVDSDALDFVDESENADGAAFYVCWCPLGASLSACLCFLESAWLTLLSADDSKTGTQRVCLPCVYLLPSLSNRTG